MMQSNIPPELLEIIAKAEHALQKERFSKAVAHYDRAIANAELVSLTPELLSGLYLSRGFAKRRCISPREALTDFKHAMDLNPLSFKPPLNAGLVYGQDLGQYPEAIAEFDKSLAIHPTLVDALSSRALTKMLIGDHPGAEKDLKSALSIEPENPDALCNLGNLHLERGEVEQAAETYQKALRVNPQDAEIRCNLALSLIRMGLPHPAGSVLREDRRAMRLWKRRGGPLPDRTSSVARSFVFITVTVVIVMVLIIKLRWF